jgi:DNA-directed RNA polymerase subunit K/omega
MSDIDVDETFDDQLDPDIYLDEDELENNKNDFLPNKTKIELDNDDNENDYIDDKDEEGEEGEEGEDADLNDDNYDYDEEYADLYDEIDDDIEDDENKKTNNINKKNKISTKIPISNKNKVSFIDNELENDSKIQYIIKNDEKITSNILTIYEITELIGIRATQIANGAPIFTDIEYISDPIEMAKKEIINNKCPLYVKRYIGLDKYELWDPNTMIKPKL